MKAFKIQLEKEYRESSDEKYSKQNEIQRRKKQIADAVIGYGRALEILTVELEKVENELKLAIDTFKDSDVRSRFIEEFEIDPYELDFTSI